MLKVKLHSSDGEVFDLDDQLAPLSGHIQRCLEDAGDDDVVLVFLPFDSAILRKVLQWAEFHKDDLIPVVDFCYEPGVDYSDDDTDDISPWDVDFLKDEGDKLMALLDAAVFLDIKGMITVVSKTVANIIKNSKSVEEIRETLNIANDFTPAEEEQVRRETGFLRKM